MFELQSSPTALGAEKNIVVRKLVWACRAELVPLHGDQPSVGRLVLLTFITGGLMRFKQHQVYIGLPLN